jgi:hypothetical protein
MSKLILHIEVEGFNADGLDEYAAIMAEPNPPTMKDQHDARRCDRVRDAAAHGCAYRTWRPSMTSYQATTQEGNR